MRLQFHWLYLEVFYWCVFLGWFIACIVYSLQFLSFKIPTLSFFLFSSKKFILYLSFWTELKKDYPFFFSFWFLFRKILENKLVLHNAWNFTLDCMIFMKAQKQGINFGGDIEYYKMILISFLMYGCVMVMVWWDIC